MEKREMKFYEAPVVEVVELEAKISLLAGSDTDSSGGFDYDVPGDE